MLHTTVDQLLLGMIDNTSVFIQDIDITLIAQTDAFAQFPDGVVIQIHKKYAADAGIRLVGDAPA